MGRRRKKEKKESPFKKIDWSINPETGREILAVALVVLGAFFILSIFSAAGRLGLLFARSFDFIFGLVGYLLPFVVLAIGVGLLIPKKFSIKPASIIGLALCFLFVPALLSPYGGQIGLGVFNLLRLLVGEIATYVILSGLVVISILIVLNTSLKNLFGQSSLPGSEGSPAGAETAKVSVFTTVKNRMGIGGPQPSPIRPTGPVVAIAKDEGWELPPLDLLEISSTKASPGNIAKNVEIIQKTLKDFGIDVAMGDVNVGPAVTQHTLKPSEGVKLSNITARSNDLSLALAAHPIRIEAPIPGKSAVGIEIPNKVPAIVTLREILETSEFKNANSRSNLSIALGRDVAGMPTVIDLKKMPHLLVAGATGTGKSICLHGLTLSFLYQNSPSMLKMILVDPKRVEFAHYNGLPHLLAPVITEVDKTVNVLRWATSEMERRFKLFAETRRRDIESYNQNPPDGRLPYIVIIIDELADLMAQAANEVEAAIVRLSQMARATGIHLVVATQRPSVDVITGLIKANIIARIAFAVASQVDSRTILDQAGAEKLLGKGDMLYVGADTGKPKRVQGVMVHEKEVKAVCDWLKRKGPAPYDETIVNFIAQKATAGSIEAIDDDLYEEAKQISIQAGKASASLLQRRLRVGYARAARLLDILESEGIIGPAEGAKPRDVLVTPDQLDPPPGAYQDYYHKGQPPEPPSGLSL